MKIFETLRKWAFGVQTSISSEWLNNTVSSCMGSMYEYIDQGFQRNADLYAITSFVSSKVALLPFILYEVKDDRALKVYKSASTNDYGVKVQALRSKALKEAKSGHKIEKMLNENPNPYMTASEFKYGFALYRLLTGNSFIRGFAPEKQKGKFVELHLLPSQYVNIIGVGQYSAARAYRLSFDCKEIQGADVGHSRYFNPDFEMPSNPFRMGMSPLQAAARVVRRSNNGYDATAMAFENGGMAGILYKDGGQELTDPQRVELQQHIDQKVTGSGNYKQILAASAKMGWLQIGESPVDLGIYESLNMDLRTLCNVYHVNSAIFNDPENKTYNNIKEARKASIVDAVLPEATALRDLLNLWLVPGWEKADGKKYFIDYDASAIAELQEDMKTAAEWLGLAWWLTPNEKRHQMGYDLQGPEYDEIFIPMGITPLSNTVVTDDEKSLFDIGHPDYPFNDV